MRGKDLLQLIVMTGKLCLAACTLHCSSSLTICILNQKLTVSGESFATLSHPKRGARRLADIIPHQSMLNE